MFLKPNPYSIFYTLIVWIIGSCYGFVILSSAAGQNGDIKLFVPGEELKYNLHSTVLMNEKDGNSKNVGFFISAQVNVQVVWKQQNHRILKFKVNRPGLHIKSRKAPSPDGFVSHTSKLDDVKNQPFYAHWNNGKITEILVNREEPTSLVNFKRGISSLFQFQLIDGSFEETDASGSCSAEYASLNQHTILKNKSNCKSSDLPYFRNSEIALDTTVTSSRTVEYEFNSNFQYFKSIKAKEEHNMSVSSNNNFGSKIFSEQVLEIVENNQNKASTLSDTTVEQVLKSLVSSENLRETTLKSEKETVQIDDVKSFSTAVKDLRDQLKSENLGNVGAAKAFVKLVNLARVSSKEEIKKTLDTKKNVDILSQLLDILGYSQTSATYEAVMTKLDFSKEDQIDLCERYLWALSLAAHPNINVVENLFVKYKKSVDIPAKLNETLLLTLASMNHKLYLSPSAEAIKMSERFEKLVLEKLRASKGEESYPYIRALKNLKSPTTIPDLLKKIKEGTTKEGSLAWKALKDFRQEHWTIDVKNRARKAFLQLDRKHDSSSRTIASEILLESNPDDKQLREIIHHVASNDTAFEIKQYALQKIRMMSDDNLKLRKRVLDIMRQDKFINNYSVLNPRGLSTAIKRNFANTSSGHGNLVSLQEINNAVVKRGVVNIMWDAREGSSQLFSLGIFTSGLSSFLSSENEEDDEEPEQTSAGMELTVLGTQLRPFVFFNGQGELMGHVWSGTASERTTAYQALIMLQDHSQFIRLGSGFIVELEMKGAASFDLAGKVEISLWGRTADSLVEKCAGIFLMGSMKVDTSFVRSQVEFTVALEPQLKLESDIDFSSNIRFCMKLSQNDVSLNHNIYKIERIPGTKHKLRVAKKKKTKVPGVTYALNRKNDRMCSEIHQ